LPEWAIWHVMALVGFVLALGGNTPAGSLLVHLPLFGGLRLQSRNILVADLALAVLLAYWADQPLSDHSRRFLRAPGGRRVDLVVFAILSVVAVLPGLGSGPGPGRGADAPAGWGGQAAAAPPSGQSGAAAPAPGPRPIAALGFPGRFAIYDLGQIAAHELPVLGAPDLH